MSAANTVEIAVIGAGVVGLAIARAFARAGREVVVLEGERAIGTHTSSRNSEVVHAGFYYPTGSLKARFCVAGRRMLWEFAEEHSVELQRLGKLVVATEPAEHAVLEEYQARGLANGVEGLELIDAAAARALEPEVRCTGAMWSPATGIIDAHGLMLALLRDAQRHDAVLALDAPVVAGRVANNGIELEIGGSSAGRLQCALVINSAGLFAQQVARSIAGVPASAIPPCHYARGHYFTLAGSTPFHHLVYPVAVQGGLGIHLTLDRAGQGRFGPDVDWIDRIDYGFDEARAPIFEAAVRRYYPALQAGALRPGYTGIRPKLGPAGSPAQDFVIQGPRDHGVPGLINLFGIESPGLTASLAIAEHTISLLG